MSKKFEFVILVIGILFLSACKPSTHKINNQTTMFKFPYNLQSPDIVLELPPILKEISALSMLSDTELICLQDEDAVIFAYDLVENKISDRIAFGKSADFEGIEKVNDVIYVLQSDGTIYEIVNFGNENQLVQVHKNFLSEENNAEGLGYDAETNSLLIACKGKASKGKKWKDKKAVYHFDLKTMKLDKKPFFLFDKMSLYTYIERNDIKNLSFKMKKEMPFNPSGIAVKDGLYFTIASIGEMIIVTDKMGKIQHAEKINNDILPKPEGITFDAGNRMIIASEGENGNGRIAIFNPTE